MTYYDKYHCINCPVGKYCGTMVGCIRLCHSYDDSVAQKESQHILTLSKAATAEEGQCAEEQVNMGTV